MKVNQLIAQCGSSFSNAVQLASLDRYRMDRPRPRPRWLALLIGRRQIVEDLSFHVAKSARLENLNLARNHRPCIHSALFLKEHRLPSYFLFSEYLRFSMSNQIIKQLVISRFVKPCAHNRAASWMRRKCLRSRGRF